MKLTPMEKMNLCALVDIIGQRIVADRVDEAAKHAGVLSMALQRAAGKQTVEIHPERPAIAAAPSQNQMNMRHPKQAARRAAK